jgi:DNA-binding transcriptional regulator YiaG
MRPDDLKRLRMTAGLSQPELARLMHMTHFTLNRYENGRIPMSAERRQQFIEAVERGVLDRIAEARSAADNVRKLLKEGA